MTQEATPHDVTPAEAVPTVGDDGPGLLTLDNIGVRFGGRQVLSDVSFTLRKGEFAGPDRAERGGEDDPAPGHPRLAPAVGGQCFRRW